MGDVTMALRYIARSQGSRGLLDPVVSSPIASSMSDDSMLVSDDGDDVTINKTTKPPRLRLHIHSFL